MDAARLLLTRLGLRAQDLLDTPVSLPTAPTFRDYIPIIAAGVRPGTRRVYSSYWNRIDKHWGERRIDEPTPSDIRQLLVDMQSELVIRRSGRGGHSATEHMIAALRCLYRRAEEDGLINGAANPAKKVTSHAAPALAAYVARRSSWAGGSANGASRCTPRCSSQSLSATSCSPTAQCERTTLVGSATAG
ncbi:hypothetical protein BJF90_17385 [Pseudonocardia sp. CNS-004]|nr:hypothetical protein BJF90_17385 [Pseudonocardia sp. CNS-004]